MIISKTPYRISFFGGGTDYHTWYQYHGGCVLSTTINHYAHIYARVLPPFFKYKSKVVTDEKMEFVSSNNDIQSDITRSVIKYLEFEDGVEIFHHGDLPVKSGIGSSSTYTVGLLNALNALGGNMSSKKNLACEAVHIEREIIQDNVGVQDQIAAAYGGLNKITIHKDGHFEVQPIIIQPDRLQDLQNHFLLFYTGVSRKASDIAGKKMQSIKDKQQQLFEMQRMVDKAIKILTSNVSLNEFGALLDQTWKLKRGLTAGISNDFIDEMYSRATKDGAIGGKLLGAGGGGFILFFVEPDNHAAVKEALKEFLWVPFNFEFSGSQIVLYENQRYSLTSKTRRNFFHLANKNNRLSKLNRIEHV